MGIALALVALTGGCALGDAPPPPTSGPAVEVVSALRQVQQEATTTQEATARLAGLAAELREGGGRGEAELRPELEAAAAEARQAHTRVQQALSQARTAAHLGREVGSEPASPP